MVTSEQVVLWVCLVLSASMVQPPSHGDQSGASWGGRVCLQQPGCFIPLLFVLLFICCQPKTVFPKNGTRYWRSADCAQWNRQFIILCRFFCWHRHTFFRCSETVLSHLVSQRNGRWSKLCCIYLRACSDLSTMQRATASHIRCLPVLISQWEDKVKTGG